MGDNITNNSLSVMSDFTTKPFIVSKNCDRNSMEIKIDNNSTEMDSNPTAQHTYDCLLEMCQSPSASSLHQIDASKKIFIESCYTNPDAAYKLLYEFLKKVVDSFKCSVDLGKESMEEVVSWSTIYSFSIWSEFLGRRKDVECLRLVVDVLLRIVQSKLSAVFIPLRLSCSRILIQISRDVGLFVPTLPIILEPLQLQLFRKESKRTERKSRLFSLCLKMNKSELNEKAFTDSAIDEIAELLLAYSSLYSSSIAFPELVLSAIVTLKDFTQKCTDKNHVRKMKPILEKLQAHCKFIETRRRAENVDLKDVNAVNSLEKIFETGQNELKTYFGNWMKNREKQLEMQLEDEKVAEKLSEKKPEVKMSADNSEDEEMEFEEEDSDEEDVEEM